MGNRSAYTLLLLTPYRLPHETRRWAPGSCIQGSATSLRRVILSLNIAEDVKVDGLHESVKTSSLAGNWNTAAALFVDAISISHPTTNCVIVQDARSVISALAPESGELCRPRPCLTSSL
jgi:hypothetical protein